jgi:RND superfamily putative drug exporter
MSRVADDPRNSVPEEAASGVFARIGRGVVNHPWLVIIVWILGAVALAALSPGLPTTSDESSFLPRHYESIQAADLQEQAFPAAGDSAATVVFSRHDGKALTAADSATVRRITAELARKPKHPLQRVVSSAPAPNHLVQVSTVTVPRGTDTASSGVTDAIKALRKQLRQSVAGSDLSAGVTGSGAQALDSQQASNRTDSLVLVATVGLILLLLLVIFRSPLIAVLPIVLIALVSQVASAAIAFANKAFDLNTDNSISTILIVVLFGIGTDYVLFLLFRYREQLRTGQPPRLAMINAVARVGEAITSAAGVVIVAFLTLTLSTVSVLRAIGPALAIAVGATLLAGLTLVPAVVSLLGRKVFWPSRSWQRPPAASHVGSLGRRLAAHPGRYVAVSGLLLMVLGVGALGFHATFDLSSSGIPKTAESARALHTLERGLPQGATDPTEVLVHSSTGHALPDAALAKYRGALRTLRGVGDVSPPALSRDRQTADFTVTLRDDPGSTTAVNLVKGTIRDGAHSRAPAGTTAVVGGTTAVYADLQRAVNHDYRVVFPVAALVILLLLALMLRSLVVPWFLLVVVGLAFTATLGAAVFAFQTLADKSGLIFLLPVYVYLFVVALGTDYNILMIARLREETQRGRSTRDAAGAAVAHTGTTIGAAGLILAGTFASLTLAGDSILTQIGFAVSCGIALSAFVVAMFLTPALTALLGRAAWWPSRRPEPAGEPRARSAALTG